MTARRYIISGAVKRYGDVTILNGIDATISVEGITAIVGPSGAGKSTLLRMMAFLEGCDAGSILLEDGSVQYRVGDAPWPAVTCVFQKQFLWPHLTLRQNIDLPMRDIGTVDRGNRLSALISEFGMDSFVDRYPNQVSGGQAQRAALARALGVDPSVLLLDEIHTGLDFENQELVNNRLRTLADSGVSIVVVSHSLNFVESFADRIVLIKDVQVNVYPDGTPLTKIPYFGKMRGVE